MKTQIEISGGIFFTYVLHDALSQFKKELYIFDMRKFAETPDGFIFFYKSKKDAKKVLYDAYQSIRLESNEARVFYNGRGIFYGDGKAVLTTKYKSAI